MFVFITVVQLSPLSFIQEIFRHAKKETLCPFTITPIRHLHHYPKPPATTNLLSVFMGLPIWGISHQWNLTLCAPLRWAAFTQHSVFTVHRIIECISTSVPLVVKWYSIVWI